MVMERDSLSKGRGFESWQRILNRHFFTYICCKKLKCLFEKTEKVNEKEARAGSFLKKELQPKVKVQLNRGGLWE